MSDYESDNSYQTKEKNRNPVPNYFKCAYTVDNPGLEACEVTLERIQALISDGLLPATAEPLTPHPDHRTDYYHPEWVIFPLYPFTIGFKFPFPEIVNDFFSTTDLTYTQLMPDGWRVLFQFETFKSRGMKAGLKELAYGFDLRSYGSRYYGFRRNSKRGTMVIRSDPGDRNWRHEFFFIKRSSLEGGEDLPTKPLRYSRKGAPKLEVLFPAIKRVTQANYQAIVDLTVEKKTFRIPGVEAAIPAPSQSRSISQNQSRMSTLSKTTRAQDVNLDSLLAEADSVPVKKEKLGKAPLHVGERHSARLLKAASVKEEGDGSKKRKVEVVNLDEVELYSNTDVGLMLSKAMTLIQKASDQYDKDVGKWEKKFEEEEGRRIQDEKDKASLKKSNDILKGEMKNKNAQIAEANKLLMESLDEHCRKTEDLKKEHEEELGRETEALKGMFKKLITEARVRLMREYKEGKADEWNLELEEAKLRRLNGEEVDPEEVNSAPGPMQDEKEDKSKYTADDVRILYGSLSNAPEEVQKEVAQNEPK